MGHFLRHGIAAGLAAHEVTALQDVLIRVDMELTAVRQRSRLLRFAKSFRKFGHGLPFQPELLRILGGSERNGGERHDPTLASPATTNFDQTFDFVFMAILPHGLSGMACAPGPVRLRIARRNWDRMRLPVRQLNRTRIWKVRVALRAEETQHVSIHRTSGGMARCGQASGREAGLGAGRVGLWLDEPVADRRSCGVMRFANLNGNCRRNHGRDVHRNCAKSNARRRRDIALDRSHTRAILHRIVGHGR
jgi:hypothetical protein